ncbi:MAG: hypothetical protein HYW91_01625 [Candidatus Sungbacteria bacterium]|nr:hypothetical protein [Candidatus Sungbacteria bacterium]
MKFWVIFGAVLFVGSLAAAAEEPVLPNWESWECGEFQPAVPYGYALEISVCSLDDSGAKFIYRMVGGKPFLIVWGYDPMPWTADSMQWGYAALLGDDGRWVVGARGKKYLAVEKPRGTFTFAVRNEDGSVRAKRVMYIFY